MTALILVALGAWAEIDLGTQLEAVRGRPPPERVVQLSAQLLGAPYAFSPLGEGEGRDADPRIRYDAFDCLTLVEQVMAAALAPTPDDVLPTLDTIRYSGAPAWETRNHVMEAQWLPSLQRRGYLKDITREVAGPIARKAKKQLSAATWREKEGAGLHLPASARPMGTFALDLIPVARAPALLSKAPAGTVVVVVRGDSPKRITRVSHVGILVQGPNGPMLRHASRSFKHVTDEPVAHYFGRNLEFAAWTVEGVALFEVTTPKH